MAHYPKAETFYLDEKNINEKKFGKDDLKYAESCNSLASLYFDMGQLAKAEPLLVEAKDIREKALGKEHPDYIKSCTNLAMLYSNMRQNEKAEPLFIETKNAIEKLLGKKNQAYAKICGGLASFYFTIGEYKKAEPLFVEAKNITETLVGKNDLDYARTCNNLATLYSRAGQTDEAEPLLFEARRVMKEKLGSEHPEYAAVSLSIGNLYTFMGNYKKAEPFYLEAKEIREKILGKGNPDYIKTCNNLASLYGKMGDFEKEQTLLLESKTIWEKLFGKDNADYASTCNNIAGSYLHLGEYEKAELLFLETKEIYERTLGKEHPEYGATCNNLALLYNTMGQFNKALPLFLEARQLTEKSVGKEHSNFANSCFNLGILYAQLGQFEKAEPLLLEARQVWEKVLGRENRDYAISCNGLAAFYEVTGQFEKAEPFYLEAKQIRERVLGAAHPEYAKSCNSLGVLYWNLKDFKKAHDFFAEAFTVQYEGMKKVFQFTSETEKQHFLRNINDLGKQSLSFTTTSWSPSNQGLAYDISLANRGLILSSSQQLRSFIFETNDGTLQTKYNDWVSLRERLSYWYLKPKVQRPGNFADLESKANDVEKELTNFSPAFKMQQTQNAVNWQTIQQHLKPNEAAIEFVAFEYNDKGLMTDSVYYIALVLRKESPEPEMVRLFERKQLNAILNEKSNQFVMTRINALYSGSAALYRLIWKPLENSLNGISKIYFAAAGDLFKIQFAAIPLNAKQTLGEKYQLIQLNSTAAVNDDQADLITASDKLALFGGIQYDGNATTLKQAASRYTPNATFSRTIPDDLSDASVFQYLPGTLKEVEGIKQLANGKHFTATLTSGSNAVEEAIKALDGNQSPAILHISTHGFFFPDPKVVKRDKLNSKFDPDGKAFKQSDDPLLRSGLIFSGANNAWTGKPIKGIDDGILTAYEVSNLYLPNTKLVVLSACETALGDVQGSEGVYGLQRAFKIAGAKNLVMSLWEVSDNETSEFMQLFYKNLFAKQSINDAFFNTQKFMRNKYRAEPFKWAAWILLR